MALLKTIALTMGDPAGIGPEVITKALSSDDLKELKKSIRFLIIGHQDILARTAKQLDIKFSFNKISAGKHLSDHLKGTGHYLLHLDHPHLKTEPRDSPCATNGRASLDYILQAIELATTHQVDAIVTAPVSKQAINLSGYPFTGHTELFAQKTNSRKVVMMFVSDRLRVALVTTHLAYKKVPLRLNVENILDTITTTAGSLQKYFGFFHPRVGVCALNPHAGEGGWLGNEEKTVIKPAVEAAEKQGIICLGPFPADSLFQRAIAGHFDAVIALYHDQALIPVKVLGYRSYQDRILSFNPAVNVTLGLPIIRTSVAHGTAFDIAGQGLAQPDSMINALKLAFQMVQNQPDLF